MTTKLTAQEILDRADKDLKPKLAVLTSSITDLQGKLTAEQVLTVANNAQKVTTALNTLTTNTKNLAERPFPVAEGKGGLKLGRELQAFCNTATTELINNKAAITSLQVANLNPLLRQNLQDILSATLGSLDAIIEVAPSELLAEYKAVRKELEDAMKKALVVYQ